MAVLLWPSGWSCPASFSTAAIPFCPTAAGTSCSTASNPSHRFNGINMAPVHDPFTTWRDMPTESPDNETVAVADAKKFRRWLIDYQEFRVNLGFSWLKAQRDVVKRIAPNQLVSTGLSLWNPLLRLHRGVIEDDPDCPDTYPLSKNEGPSGVYAWNAREVLRTLDFIDIHYYPGYPWEGEDCLFGRGRWPDYPTSVQSTATRFDDMSTDAGDDNYGGHLEYMRHLARYSRISGKPVIFGEFGQAPRFGEDYGSTGGTITWIDEDAIASYHEQAVYRTAGDVAGWLAWTLHTWPTHSADVITEIDGLLKNPSSCGGTLCPTKWGEMFADLKDRTINPPGLNDTFASLVQNTFGDADPRTANHGPVNLNDRAFTDEDYLRGYLGGPMDPGTGSPMLNDSVPVGDMSTTTSSDVWDFGQVVNGQVTEQLEWDARIEAHEVPEVMLKNNAYTMSVSVRNTGSEKWFVSSGNVKLRRISGLSTTDYSIPADVDPMAKVVMNVSITPTAEGAFSHSWVMVDTGTSPNPRTFGEKLATDGNDVYRTRRRR